MMRTETPSESRQYINDLGRRLGNVQRRLDEIPPYEPVNRTSIVELAAILEGVLIRLDWIVEREIQRRAGGAP